MLFGPPTAESGEYSTPSTLSAIGWESAESMSSARFRQLAVSVS